MFNPQVLPSLLLACAHAQPLSWAVTLSLFSLSRVFCSESLSLSLRQNPSFSFSLALFLPLSNRDSLSSSESRFFVRSLALSHILFSSFSLNLPLFSIQVTFCLTSLVPPPPLILSSLGLQYSTSPPFEHTESRVVCHGDQGAEIERNHDVNMKKRSNLLTRRSLIHSGWKDARVCACLMVTTRSWVYDFGVCLRVYMRVRVRVLFHTLAREKNSW